MRPGARRIVRGVGCVALIGLGMLGGPAPTGNGDPRLLTVVRPPPTADPAAPGIVIASADADLPDPFLLDDGGVYYLYDSTSFGDSTQNVPLRVGQPGHWSQSVDAVPRLPAWAVGDPAPDAPTWSPSVYKLGGVFVMYLAPGLRGSQPPQHCIAIGTARDPAGPFHLRNTPFICQRDLGGDIDPQVFVDRHGPDGPSRPNYLVWKADNNSTPGDGATTIWAAPLSNDGFHLTGRPVPIFAPDQSWQRPLVEAPQMVLSPSSAVWMFFSAGTGFFSPDYGMGAVRCAGPLGPCADPLPGPLITSNAQGAGPGEEMYFQGPDSSDWLLYSPEHNNVPTYLLRPVEAARIGWNNNGPFVAAAGAFPLSYEDLGVVRSSSGSRRAEAGSR